MKSMTRSFGNHLRSKRLELGISEAELAALSGIPVDVIREVEKGRGCSFQCFGKLMTFLNIGKEYA